MGKNQHQPGGRRRGGPGGAGAPHTAFVRVSAGKARQGVVNIFGLASLNNFRGPEL